MGCGVWVWVWGVGCEVWGVGGRVGWGGVGWGGVGCSCIFTQPAMPATALSYLGETRWPEFATAKSSNTTVA